MLDPKPRVPSNLNPFARELLESLRGQPAARHIILGGGVALSHYHEYRDTVDVDAWWDAQMDSGDAETLKLVRDAMGRLAANHQLEMSERQWGDTRSIELRRGSRKIFSFQISTRDVHLAASVPADWEPVRLETFRDNLGAKMMALVERGAPRDFVDIFKVCEAGLASVEDCWATWLLKHPPRDSHDAKLAILHTLCAIETRRPLESIHDPAQRQLAERVRKFIRDLFCATGSSQ